MHFVGRTGVTKAQKMSAIDRIKINAGSCGNAGLVQHPSGKVKTVVRKSRDVCIEIKGAVHRQKFVEARLRQSIAQDAAVFLVTVLHLLHFFPSVESSFAGKLRER